METSPPSLVCRTSGRSLPCGPVWTLALGLLLAAMPALGCAKSGTGTPSVVGGPGSQPPTGDSEPSASSGASAADDKPIGEPTSPRARVIDAELRASLVSVYGEASLVGEERVEGPGEVIEELRYRLGRAHREDDGGALVESLGGLGYAIERALVDDVAAAIFAFGQGSDLILKADVGSTSLVVSIASRVDDPAAP